MNADFEAVFAAIGIATCAVFVFVGIACVQRNYRRGRDRSEDGASKIPGVLSE